MLNITDARIRLIEKSGNLKAAATITIDDAFAVHDIKVIDAGNGPFITMPNRRISDDRYADIAHPVNQETREQIQKLVLDKYNEALAAPQEVSPEE
jgi:stage V sporulation protein G